MKLFLIIFSIWCHYSKITLIHVCYFEACVIFRNTFATFLSFQNPVPSLLISILQITINLFIIIFIFNYFSWIIIITTWNYIWYFLFLTFIIIFIICKYLRLSWLEEERKCRWHLRYVIKSWDGEDWEKNKFHIF